jgi:hypothetical protein
MDIVENVEHDQKVGAFIARAGRLIKYVELKPPTHEERLTNIYGDCKEGRSPGKSD